MLQQTQVARVLPAYGRFLERFPTLTALARAPLADVLRAWSGLGYNRRARSLHLAARACGPSVPEEPAALDALPGIGPYTAAAVACFAFGRQVPFADVNIRRTLGRIFIGRVASEREAIALDAQLVAAGPDAARWHHALMDLGATVCTAREPRCQVCPVGPLCAARGRPTEAPRRRPTLFATSDRRVRGAILRALTKRSGAMSIGSLSRIIGDARVPRLVARLEEDGLVEMRGGRVRLPLDAHPEAITDRQDRRVQRGVAHERGVEIADGEGVPVPVVGPRA